MRLRFGHVLAAGAVAALVGAPAAIADDPGQSCTQVSAGSECSSPGNVQINDSPPALMDNGFDSGTYGGPYPVPFDEGSQ